MLILRAGASSGPPGPHDALRAVAAPQRRTVPALQNPVDPLALRADEDALRQASAAFAPRRRRPARDRRHGAARSHRPAGIALACARRAGALGPEQDPART